MSAKQRVLRAVRALPNDGSMAQITEHVTILAAIERGEEDIAAGRTMTHEDARGRTRTPSAERSRAGPPDRAVDDSAMPPVSSPRPKANRLVSRPVGEPRTSM